MMLSNVFSKIGLAAAVVAGSLAFGQAGDVVAARAALADYEAAALEAIRKAVAGV